MSPVFHSSPLPLPCCCTWWNLKRQVRLSPLCSRSPMPGGGGGGGVSRSSSSSSMGFDAINNNSSSQRDGGVTWCFFNPTQDPIIKEALKEPVAFFGGVFAGILRLDLNEEPLKEWVTRTVEAAGITEEETDAEGSATEAAPQEIEIE